MVRRDEQVAALCSRMSPPELSTAIVQKNSSKLTENGLTPTNATKLLGRFDASLCRQLERVPTEALVQIQLRREGELTYTDLKDLSVGEKCSAVLAIALLNKGRPLVIDQPEDDLDHSFVIRSGEPPFCEVRSSGDCCDP
jgi:ATPase subunit of ABC transporter with duplicated ATPase domains